MKILFVGDVHATQNEVEECGNLLHFVDEVSKTTKPDYILFAGDITHNHGILYPSVLHLWDKWLKCDIKTIILKGNHDCSLSEPDLHCLNAFKRDNLIIVAGPMKIERVIFLPFIPHNEQFSVHCEASDTDFVFCHQDFLGAKYDNGFPILKGANSKAIKQQIISGHIHKAQENENVWYPGSPRWRTMADANEEKGIWLLDINGKNITREFINTNEVCKPIILLEDSQERPVDMGFLSSICDATVWIYIRGTESYICERKVVLEKHNVKIKTFPTTSISKVRESDGISIAFHKFIGLYKPKNNTETKVLRELAYSRIGILKGQ